ncbi:MAG: DUF3795 domain-containing protein [Bacteroidota bacterium]
MDQHSFAPDLVGYCGFYCGSCPTLRAGRCSGCRRAHRPGDCFTNTCVQEKGLRFCGECRDFPCDDLLHRERATVLDQRWLAWKRNERNA